MGTWFANSLYNSSRRFDALEKSRFTDLPKFRFHSSPFQTGALIDSDEACECCGQARGYMYDGPIRTSEEVERVCPWCIADGSAAAKWDAEFTDGYFCDRHRDHVELPDELYDEVFRRTPGVVGALQSVYWWVHCELPAAFIGVEEDRIRFKCIVCGKKCSFADPD